MYIYIYLFIYIYIYLFIYVFISAYIMIETTAIGLLLSFRLGGCRLPKMCGGEKWRVWTAA